MINPPLSSEYLQEVYLGLLWFSISAKGTNASVFYPSIFSPNILEEADILAQQNSLNEYYLNSSEILHI